MSTGRCLSRAPVQGNTRNYPDKGGRNVLAGFCQAIKGNERSNTHRRARGYQQVEGLFQVPSRAREWQAETQSAERCIQQMRNVLRFWVKANRWDKLSHLLPSMVAFKKNPSPQKQPPSLASRSEMSNRHLSRAEAPGGDLGRVLGTKGSQACARWQRNVKLARTSAKTTIGEQLGRMTAYADIDGEEMKKLFCAVLSFACVECMATNWQFVSETDRSVMTAPALIAQVDLDSVRSREGIRQAWTRYSFAPAKRSSAGQKNWIESALAFDLYDCKTEEVASVQYTEYPEQFGHGEAGYSLTLPRDLAAKRMSTPIPGTTGDIVLKFVCAFPIKQSTQ